MTKHLVVLEDLKQVKEAPRLSLGIIKEKKKFEFQLFGLLPSINFSGSALKVSLSKSMKSSKLLMTDR